MKKNILEVLCIAMLYFAASVSLNDSLNPIALYGAIPLCFILSFSISNSLKSNKYVKQLVLLIIWIAFTYLGATFMKEASNQMKNLLGVFIFSVALANLAKDRRCIPWLYGIFIILLIQALVYANEHIMVAGFDIATDRLNDEKLNANTVAYYTFFVTFALYELGNSFLVRNRILTRIFRVLFLLMYVVSFSVAILTASRQVLIIQLPLLCLLTYIRYIKGANIKNKVLFVIIAIALCASFTNQITNIYDNSFLKVRAEKDVEDDARTLLLKDALKVGLQHPIMGVGPGNYVRYSYSRHFSHCTYTELFANTGVIGFIIYINLLFLFLKKQYKRMRLYKDKTFVVFLVGGLIYFFDNFFYVFYIDLWLIGFFILIASHSEVYYNLKRINRN